MSDELIPAPGRSCGSCTLCCKVYEVPVLAKAPGKWCTHCKPGRGCGIWETRPQFCRTFYCRYMLDPMFGPEWKPDVAKFVMNYQPNNTFSISCDPGARHAWKKEPYYTGLKRMALQLLNAGITLYVSDGFEKIIVTPDEDVVVSRVDQVPNYEILKVERGSQVSWRVKVSQVNEASA